jgi:PTH1 family peptidyl-tRNA hydrolase
MQLLFIGLGNPGREYEDTRHNIGFRVIDELIKNSEARDVSKASFYGKVYKSQNLLFAQPTTYMNLSGKSVIAIKNFFKIDIENIIVIHDDLDLPFGALKFKIGGGHGGHNGLKSIDNTISKEYIRVRMGIGKPEHKSQVSSFVLSNFSDTENDFLDKYINHTVEAISKLKSESLDVIKSKYSLKSIDSIK